MTSRYQEVEPEELWRITAFYRKVCVSDMEIYWRFVLLCIMLVANVTPVSAAAQRFGPPDQPYYYKKSDDVQQDDPEVSLRTQSINTKERRPTPHAPHKNKKRVYSEEKADGAVTRRRDTHGNQRKSDLNQKDH
ncbi:uncharacterized protein [Labrus bergylta]|uniref:uncharacterized protein isoform X5 n=2 Tax=Labrus bergylta TaxID=56723 RepID=UPI003313E79C